jgi:hypothetical protein
MPYALKRSYGFVRGLPSDRYPYRDTQHFGPKLFFMAAATETGAFCRHFRQNHSPGWTNVPEKQGRWRRRTDSDAPCLSEFSCSRPEFSSWFGDAIQGTSSANRLELAFDKWLPTQLVQAKPGGVLNTLPCSTVTM